MPRKVLNPYDVVSTLIEKEWSVTRLAKHFGVTETTIREKLQSILYEIQSEIMDLESDEQSIEEALKR